MLFKEILKSPCGSQAVNGVYMYPNTQYKNETMGKELVKIIDICDSCALEIFSVAVNINICWNNTIQTILRLNETL